MIFVEKAYTERDINFEYMRHYWNYDALVICGIFIYGSALFVYRNDLRNLLPLFEARTTFYNTFVTILCIEVILIQVKRLDKNTTCKS